MFNRRFLSLCIGLHCVFMATQANAGISLSATRLVFDGAHKEVSITVRNSGDDLLIQSWIESNDPQALSAPFAVTPPLARIMGKQQQLLRVIYEGGGMPTDKESVVWLNVQEIPQTAATKNTLQLAVRQRIKVFFRPAGLATKAYLAPTQLLWQLAEQDGHTVLQVSNPGVYHVSLAELTLESGSIREQPFDSTMIAPGQHKSFALKQITTSSAAKLNFLTINDYGAQERYTAAVSRSATNANPAP